MSEKLSFQDRTAQLSEVVAALGDIAETLRATVIPCLEAEVVAMVGVQQRFAAQRMDKPRPWPKKK